MGGVHSSEKHDFCGFDALEGLMDLENELLQKAGYHKINNCFVDGKHANVISIGLAAIKSLPFLCQLLASLHLMFQFKAVK